jgi:hypothetical protein
MRHEHLCGYIMFNTIHEETAGGSTQVSKRLVMVLHKS